MKIALCDDDEKELSNIRSLLDSYQKTHNIPFTYQEYHSSCELALRASKERFDIYLLDILMPHMTGIAACTRNPYFRPCCRYYFSYNLIGFCGGKLYGKGHQLSDEAGILQRFLCCHG